MLSVTVSLTALSQLLHDHSDLSMSHGLSVLAHGISMKRQPHKAAQTPCLSIVS